MKDAKVGVQVDGEKHPHSLLGTCPRSSRRVSGDLEEAHGLVVSRKHRTWTNHGCGERCTLSMVCIMCEQDQEGRWMMVTTTLGEAGQRYKSKPP